MEGDEMPSTVRVEAARIPDRDRLLAALRDEAPEHLENRSFSYCPLDVLGGRLQSYMAAT